MKLEKKSKRRILITVLSAIIILIAFYLITYTITKYTGFSVYVPESIGSFENCLKQQDITLYINSDNSNEVLKSIQVYDYLQYVKIQNCYRNNEVCAEKDVKSSVAWIINGNKVDRDVSLPELSGYSGCS